MRPKVELTQIRGFSETIDDAILFFKQNFKPLLKSYFTICGVLWAAALVISVINQLQSTQLKANGESIFTAAYFVNLFVALLNMMALSLTTLCYISVYQQKEKETPTVPEVWGYFKFYFFRFTGSYILLSIALIISFFFCGIPFFYFLPIFMLVFAIMVIENASLSYAFNRAFKLISDNWGNVFAIVVVIYLLLTIAMLLGFIPIGLISGIIAFLTGKHYEIAEGFLFTFNISSHITSFLTMLMQIAIALVYYSLTEQKDDVMLFERIAKLGVHDSTVTPSDEEEQY